MRVHIDESRCSGHGRCYAVAADLMDADDQGYGTVLTETVPEPLREQARRAAGECPERAVVIEDDG